MLQEIKQNLQKLNNPEKAKKLSRFFKTGKGQYGEGDLFLGITVPQQRKIAKKYKNTSFNEIRALLHSPIHEYRLTALLILREQYKKKNEKLKKEIIDFYLQHTSKINNWDLVDLSADHILGDYLYDKDKVILFSLAQSHNLWERRISIVATFAFIKKNQFEEALEISRILLHDKHDLIHKAVGWMLREIGKRNFVLEEAFLQQYHKEMPRTMLRYAIERFPKEKRAFYLLKKNSLKKRGQ